VALELQTYWRIVRELDALFSRPASCTTAMYGVLYHYSDGHIMTKSLSKTNQYVRFSKLLNETSNIKLNIRSKFHGVPLE